MRGSFQNYRVLTDLFDEKNDSKIIKRIKDEIYEDPSLKAFCLKQNDDGSWS